MPSDLRFVLDTNVVVSALLLKRSLVRQAFNKATLRGRLLISEETLKELNQVLRRRDFDKYILEDERIQFLTALVKEAELVEITEAVMQCRDPKDNKFLELAVNGRARCIVSGDDDLLAVLAFATRLSQVKRMEPVSA